MPVDRSSRLSSWLEVHNPALSRREAADPQELLPDLRDTLLELRQRGERQSAELARRAPPVLAAAASRFQNALQDSAVAARIAHAARMSPEMVREAAGNFLPQLSEPALHQFQQSAVASNPAASPRARPLAPAVVFHVPAGNLFLSALESLIHAALVGSCSLVRCPSSGTEALRLWRDCLNDADPDFARSLVLARWPREASPLTSLAAQSADAVVAFGSDESVAAVHALTPVATRFLPHGTKLSFALIGEEALAKPDPELAQLAQALAYDFSVYDQQGCLSPRAAFLQVRDAASARPFAQLLQAAMADLASRLPAPRLSLEEAASLARVREHAAIEIALGAPTALLSSPTDPFVVTLSPASGYAPGCLNRFADLRTFSSAEDLKTLLAPWRGKVSTLGLAALPEAESLAFHLRATRLCPIGQMQKPPLGWTHDGQLPLSSLLEWMGVEKPIEGSAASVPHL